MFESSKSLKVTGAYLLIQKICVKISSLLMFEETLMFSASQYSKREKGKYRKHEVIPLCPKVNVLEFVNSMKVRTSCQGCQGTEK